MKALFLSMILCIFWNAAASAEVCPDSPTTRWDDPARMECISRQTRENQRLFIAGCDAQVNQLLRRMFRNAPVETVGMDRSMYGDSMMFTVNGGEWHCAIPITGTFAGTGITCTNTNVRPVQQRHVPKSRMPRYCYGY